VLGAHKPYSRIPENGLPLSQADLIEQSSAACGIAPSSLDDIQDMLAVAETIPPADLPCITVVSS
jgi:hypothetical protein